jgi:signal transduction histidine kinase
VAPHGFDYVVGLEAASCRDLVAAGGGLLVATEQGVYSLLHNGRVEPLRDPRLSQCTRLVPLPETPDRLLAVCQGNRLHRLRLRNGRWDYETEIEWLKPHSITSAVADGPLNLWLGTEAGLFRVQFRTADDAFPQVEAVALTGKSPVAERLYVGQFLGQLHVLTEEQALAWNGRAFSRASGEYLPRKSNSYLLTEVLSMPLAGDSRYLVWSQNGRLEWLSKRGDSLRNGASDVLALLPPLQALALRGDSLWLATERTVYRLHLGRLPAQALPNKQFACLVRGARLVHGSGERDSLIDLRQPLNLGYAPLYRLYLTLDVNTFDAPERLIYQLETQDGSWTNLVSHQEVVNLTWSYGTQQVRVRAADAFGNVSQPAELRYRIEPPFWLRWYVLALYAIGLVVLAYLGVRAVERRAERKAQARNAALERLVAERTAVIDAQKQELQALVRDLNDKNAELELQQTVIQRTNEELEALNHELIENRSQLVQNEKLAALGEITPAIAHEINSPLGAMSNTLDTMSQHLPQLLATLPGKLTALTAENAEGLRQLVPQLITRPVQLSAREERRAIRSLAATLADLGLQEAEHLADRLVKTGLHQQLDNLTPLLLGPDREAALAVLEPVAAVGRQLEVMRRSVERSIHIVKALKNYVHRRTDSETPIGFNLTENIELVLTLYDYHIRRGIELVQDYHEMPEVVGFPEELSQVWTNLIMNAVYALNLRIREAQLAGESFQAQLRIVVQQVDDYAEVRFIDNGPGIPEPIQNRIFEALFTTKPKGEGTGLGLSICRKIVDKHSGQISFESRPGHTEFVVRLPLAGPSPDA